MSSKQSPINSPSTLATLNSESGDSGNKSLGVNGGNEVNMDSGESVEKSSVACVAASRRAVSVKNDGVPAVRARARLSRIDWFRVFADLAKAGYTLPTVASTLGISYGTLAARRNEGHEPRYQDGEALVALWCLVLNRPWEELPRDTERILSAAKLKA